MKTGKGRFSKYVNAAILLLSGFLLIAASGKKKDVVEFDFKKTSGYMHESLDKRPDFPISVVLMHDYVYSLLALGENFAPQTKDSMINFAKKTQKADGGFSVDVATKGTSSLYTDYVIDSLSLLGSINSIDVSSARTYLSSLRQPDGGFSFDAKKKESALTTTYYAVHALNALNSLNLVDAAKTAAYVKGFENKNTGGFKLVKGEGISTPKNTYMAVYVLKTIGMLDDSSKKSAIKFLTSTPYVGKFKKYDITQTLEEQAFTIMALKMLGAGDKINKNKVVAFIKSFYIPENGGFGPIHGYGSAPDPTYFGILGLSELGMLKKPIENRLK